MSKGLNNYQIDDFFKEEENEYFKKSYMGTYSIDSITIYINFFEIIKRRNAKYPFAIFNTDKENEPSVHWWSFVDIHPKNNLFLFDSFGLEGFKLFIVENDQQIINELLYNFKKCESKSAQKLQLFVTKFCVEIWQKMPQERKHQLLSFTWAVCKTQENSMHEFTHFRKYYSRINICNLWSISAIFYKNLFDPGDQSKILNHQKLTKNTLETRINEIFSTDVNENEYGIKIFKEEFNL